MKSPNKYFLSTPLFLILILFSNRVLSANLLSDFCRDGLVQIEVLAETRPGEHVPFERENPEDIILVKFFNKYDARHFWVITRADPPYPESVDFIGGRVDPTDDSLESALIREVDEEVDGAVSNLKPLHKISFYDLFLKRNIIVYTFTGDFLLRSCAKKAGSSVLELWRCPVDHLPDSMLAPLTYYLQTTLIPIYFKPSSPTLFRRMAKPFLALMRKWRGAPAASASVKSNPRFKR